MGPLPSQRHGDLSADQVVRRFPDLAVTYVLALQYASRTSIIADTRVSWRTQAGTKQGTNTSLKSGILFPGCTYATVGNAREAGEFLVLFKETVSGRTLEVADIWSRFKKYTSEYRYPAPDKSFQVVLSSRCEGHARLFLVDSARGNLQKFPSGGEVTLHTFGSGKKLLDPLVEREFLPRLKDTHKFMLEAAGLSKEIALSLWPFHLCLWLSELSLTFEASALEAHDVGGVFHFVSQTDAEEASQGAALYVMSAVDHDRKRIVCWGYRVIGVEGGLFIERHDPPTGDDPEHVERTILFDRAARLDIEVYSQELKRLVVDRLSTLPFYTFFGVGSTQPESRRCTAFTYAANGKKSDLFDEAGEPTPVLAQMVEYYHLGPQEGLEWKPGA